MITSDAHYSPYADLHVPDACASPVDLTTGCLFPGATNYAPGAVQSGTCHYRTIGCTSSTALNYNPEASISDYCVEPVYGCTLKTASYDGVDSNTPGFKSLHVGVPTTNVGTINVASIGNVKTHNPAANVLSGCEVIIEGCMDPTAVNYEPRANSQTYTWCVPRFTGCMMPTQKVQSTSMNTLSEGGFTRTHAKDSGSANFDPSATVNQLGSCVVGRVGCMSSTALNYDSKATYNEGCFEPTEGCLDRTALNFNCSTRTSITPCTDASPTPTNHSSAVCIYSVSPPPAPSPSIPKGAAATEAVVIEILAEGSVSDFTEDDITDLQNFFAAQLGVDPSKVTIVIVPASVKIVATIIADDMAQAETLRTTATAALGSTPQAVTSFLRSSGVSVRALDVPVVQTKVVVLVGPPSPPPAVPVGAIVGGVIGGIFPTLIAAGAYYMYKKKKMAKTTYPA